MNIYRIGKSGCEISIDHCRNACKNKTFSIQVTENFPGNGYENGIKENAMLEYRLKPEDYWMKTHNTLYPLGLNEWTKSMYKNSLMGKLFPLLPRYGDYFIGKGTRSIITNHDLSSDIDF